MTRPKSNTPEGEIAAKKWKATMVEKYGSEEALHAHLVEMGTKGGRKTGIKGFALNPALARKAGAIGGKRSSRLGIKNGEGKKKRNATT